MNIAGIDLSLTGTGMISFNESTKKFVDNLSKSKPNGKTPFQETARLLDIKSKIVKFIEDNDCKLVLIEGLAFNARNTVALVQLAGLNYLIREYLFNKGIIYYIVAPTTLKKFITGKGNCQKDFMLLETYKKYKISFCDDNLCDAYGLARIGYAIVDKKEYSSLTKPQVEVINLIKSQYGTT